MSHVKTTRHLSNSDSSHRHPLKEASFSMENAEPPASLVYSVQEFCDEHKIGRNLFYKLLNDGSGPQIMKLGRRTLISREAATAWRKKMEQQTEQQMLKNAAQTSGWISIGSE